MSIKVKPEFLKQEFGFNNLFAPLGKRDDLHLLAADAKAGNNKHLLEMFEPFTDKDLKEAKEEFFNKKQAEKEAARKKLEKVKPHVDDTPQETPGGQPVDTTKDTTAGVQEEDEVKPKADHKKHGK